MNLWKSWFITKNGLAEKWKVDTKMNVKMGGIWVSMKL